MRAERSATAVSPLSGTGRKPERASSASVERLSDLIGDIYDCALHPENWSATLERMNREFSFSSAALGVVPLHAGGHVLRAHVGFDPAWMSVVDDESYRADAVVLWGGAERVGRYPLDEPIIGSQTAGYAARHSNRYFLEILEPRGITDGVMIAIAREPSLLGYVAFNRHRAVGSIGQAEVDGLRLLGPHFRRAVTISSLFDMRAIEAATFASVIEGMSLGVVLVDERLAVVHANPVARAMLAARDPIEARNGLVATRERNSNAALERAVSQAVLDETNLGPRGIGIPARRVRGEPCVIHVLPLVRREMRSGVASRAAAALFIAPANPPNSMPADAFALLYELTPAETRVFELITAGMTQDAIADSLGVARSTVKTHLLHVFEKTGCKRQVDLLRLSASLSLTV